MKQTSPNVFICPNKNFHKVVNKEMSFVTSILKDVEKKMKTKSKRSRKTKKCKKRKKKKCARRSRRSRKTRKRKRSKNKNVPNVPVGNDYGEDSYENEDEVQYFKDVHL